MCIEVFGRENGNEANTMRLMGYEIEKNGSNTQYIKQHNTLSQIQQSSNHETHFI